MQTSVRGVQQDDTQEREERGDVKSNIKINTCARHTNETGLDEIPKVSHQCGKHKNAGAAGGRAWYQTAMQLRTHWCIYAHIHDIVGRYIFTMSSPFSPKQEKKGAQRGREREKEEKKNTICGTNMQEE